MERRLEGMGRFFGYNTSTSEQISDERVTNALMQDRINDKKQLLKHVRGRETRRSCEPKMLRSYRKPRRSTARPSRTLFRKPKRSRNMSRTRPCGRNPWRPRRQISSKTLSDRKKETQKHLNELSAQLPESIHTRREKRTRTYTRLSAHEVRGPILFEHRKESPEGVEAAVPHRRALLGEF